MRPGPPFQEFHQQKEQMEKMLPLIVNFFTMIVIIYFSPPGQERDNWILIVGVTVRLPESDVNAGVSLTFP